MRKPAAKREHDQAISFGILPEENVLAWAEIETGRYQPRRVKGSFRGRELGWTFVLPPGRAGKLKSE